MPDSKTLFTTIGEAFRDMTGTRKDFEERKACREVIEGCGSWNAGTRVHVWERSAASASVFMVGMMWLAC